jgi:uncharacterized membrane protein YdjX (TVP38/TMEM64 family)
MNKKMVGIVCVLALVLIVWLLFMPQGQQLAAMKYYLHDFERFVQNYYLISVILFMGIFVIATVCMIPVTLLLSLLGGYLYGVIWGTVYSVGGATIGSVILVRLLRRYGQAFFGSHSTDQGQFSVVKAQIRERGMWYIMAANIMPFTPTPLINIVVSLSSMPLLLFAGATVVGLTPSTAVYTFAGRQLHMLDSMDGLLSKSIVVGMVILAVGILIFGLRAKKKSLH